jgi:hypothetical protein
VAKAALILASKVITLLSAKARGESSINPGQHAALPGFFHTSLKQSHYFGNDCCFQKTETGEPKLHTEVHKSKRHQLLSGQAGQLDKHYRKRKKFWRLFVFFLN